MSTIHLFHGTSDSRATDIMSIGFTNVNKELVWDCSDDACTYFYDREKIWEVIYGDDESTEEERTQNAIEQANGNAQITTAFEKHPANSTCVFELIIDTSEMEDVEDWVFPDDSCENMNGAVYIRDRDIKQMWKKGWIVECKIYHIYFPVKFSLMYIAMVYGNRYITTASEALTAVEKEIIEAILKSDVLEHMYDMDYPVTRIQSFNNPNIKPWQV